MNAAQYKSLEVTLSYHFQNQIFLKTALTHRSFGADNYERLEFLGDGLLNFVVAELLYVRFPEQREGVLSRLRAHLVSQTTLVKIAQHLHLHRYLRLGEGERKHLPNVPLSVLADTVESIFGAVYLDSDFLQAAALIQAMVWPHAYDLQSCVLKDAKTCLQETLQARKCLLPRYTILQITGFAHQQVFEVCCAVKIHGQPIEGIGMGKSRRAAEQHAAAIVLRKVSDDHSQDSLC